MCSILHQIFSNSETSLLLQHIKRPWETNQEKIAGLFEELWRVFVSVVKDCCVGNVVIVIDALDECVASDRKLLVSRLASLSASTDRPESLKLLITSRDDFLLRNALMRASQVVSTIHLRGENLKEAGAIQNEIDIYVEKCVDQFRKRRKDEFGYEDEASSLVRKRVLSVSNRTYLWVALVFGELDACVGVPIADIRERLRTLPSTVEDEYENILRRSKDEKRARKMLSLVLATRVNLTPTELFIALQVSEDTKTLSDLEDLPGQALTSYLRELCGSFIVFATTKRNRAGLPLDSVRVFLIHETAREFLTKPPETPKLCCTHSKWKHSIDWREACCNYARS